MKLHRVAATVAVIASIVLAIIYVPLPFHVSCTFDIAPQGAESVFAGVPGQLQEVLVLPGDEVTRGTVLARMDNVDLQLAVVALRGEREQRLAQLKNYSRLRREDDTVSAQIGVIEELLATVDKQLAEKEKELARLQIIAPVDGTVFPPPVRPERNPGDGRLPSWSGSPFETKNRGALLASADQICQIGNPQKYEAVLVIDQASIDLVTQYATEHKKWPDVDMKLDSYRWKTDLGAIDKVASAPMENTPASLASQGGGELTTKTDRDTGALRPMSTSYQARIPLEGVDIPFRVGLTGKAKIYTGWQPIGRRVARYLYRTFHFYL